MTQEIDQGSDQQGFGKNYWELHWQNASGQSAEREVPPNPYLADETVGLAPGTALDAGCGEGAEAIWLAAAGWQVTAVDISAAVLARATDRAQAAGALPERLNWIEADLSVWRPGQQFDLVTTHYAHPAIPQLAFYERISDWVAPGGSLLIVGHLHTPAHAHDRHRDDQGGPEQHSHQHRPPAAASVTTESITAVLDASRWEIVSAAEHVRALAGRAARPTQLDDVVVRATRRR